MCECCLSGPCGSNKCGCEKGCSTFRIRSLILLVLSTIIEGCAMNVFIAPIGMAKCNSGKAGIGYMSLGAVCSPGETELDKPFLDIIHWYHERFRAADETDFKDAGDGVFLLGEMAGIVAGFNGVIMMIAFFELLGYTLGSKCQSIVVIVFGILNFVFAIMGAAIPMGTKMFGDENFSTSVCTICGLTPDGDLSEGVPGPAIMSLLFGGLIALGQVGIGVDMCRKSAQETEYQSISPNKAAGGSDKSSL